MFIKVGGQNVFYLTICSLIYSFQIFRHPIWAFICPLTSSIIHLSLSTLILSALLLVSEKGVSSLPLQTRPSDCDPDLLPHCLRSAAYKTQTPLPQYPSSCCSISLSYTTNLSLKLSPQRSPWILMPRSHQSPFSLMVMVSVSQHSCTAASEMLHTDSRAIPVTRICHCPSSFCPVSFFHPKKDTPQGSVEGVLCSSLSMHFPLTAAPLPPRDDSQVSDSKK